MNWLRRLDPDVHVVLPDGSRRALAEYLLPSSLMMLAGLLLTISIFLPYWSMTLEAPQYPKGLRVDVHVNRLVGDVREIDALNHYLGMPSLNEGGVLERSISILAIVVLAALLVAGVFVHNRWAGILAIPALLFPLMFLADLAWILYRYGHAIDPNSALGKAIDPFMPPLIGVGKVGQFATVARLELGWWLACVAVIVVLIGLWYHRAAYRPIVEARRRLAAAPPSNIDRESVLL
jgi:hypothetical protein